MKLPLAKLAAQMETLAFNLASDCVKDCTYFQTTDPKYDPATGQQGSVLDPAQVAQANVSAMILKFSAKEVNGQDIKTGDERVLIRAVDLGTIVPDEDDTMTGPDNLTRQVIAISLDATRTLYTFQMRIIAQ